jgi:hypothetical protein
MTEKVTVEEEKVDELIEKAEALAAWHERAAVESLAIGVQQKFHEMLEGQGKGQIKNNQFNKGYMKALTDIYYTLKTLLNHIDGVDEEENKGEETNE